MAVMLNTATTVDRKAAAMTTNKQWAKVVQDGVELTWNHETDTPMAPEDVAKFYVDSVKALQKFKDQDPRTQPELRAQDKARKEFAKDLVSFIKWGVVVFFAAVFAYQCGAVDHGGRSEYNHRYDY